MTEAELNQIKKQIQLFVRRAEFLTRQSSITANIDQYIDEIKKCQRELADLLQLCEDVRDLPFLKREQE